MGHAGRSVAAHLWSRRRLLPWHVAHPDFEAKIVAERLDVAAQGGERVCLVAALLDARDLGLGNPQPLGHLRLGETSRLPCLDQLESQFLLGSLLSVEALELWVGQEIVAPFLVTALSIIHGTHPRSCLFRC
jgi:hypothetical protein